MNIEMHPVWEPCKDCDEYLCNLHQQHAHDCDCPGIETWVEDTGQLPYDIMIPVLFE